MVQRSTVWDIGVPQYQKEPVICTPFAYTLMKRKFKQWCQQFHQYRLNKPITSHIKSLNTKRPRHMTIEIQAPAWNRHKNVIEKIKFIIMCINTDFTIVGMEVKIHMHFLNLWVNVISLEYTCTYYMLCFSNWTNNKYVLNVCHFCRMEVSLWANCELILYRTMICIALHRINL